MGRRSVRARTRAAQAARWHERRRHDTDERDQSRHGFDADGWRCEQSGLGGAIGGSGNLSVTGPATTTITGTGTYTGNTTIGNGSTHAVGAGGSLSVGSAVNLSGTGATLDVRPTTPQSTSCCPAYRLDGEPRRQHADAWRFGQRHVRRYGRRHGRADAVGHGHGTRPARTRTPARRRSTAARWRSVRRQPPAAVR